MLTAIIGWTSSTILCATLTAQVYRQWRARKSSGVSPWLYIGQSVTSVGFLAYSILKGDLVFIVTNSFLLVVALIGLWLRSRT